MPDEPALDALAALGLTDADRAAIPALPSGCTPGRVVTILGPVHVVETGAGPVECTVAGALRDRSRDATAQPAVGDWVGIRDATITEVLPRRTALMRGAAGTSTHAQLIAANIDAVMIVAGLDHDLNPRRIERALALVWDSGAEPVVVLNKADLCEHLDATVAEVEAIAIGVPVLAVSAGSGAGLDRLDPFLGPGRTVVFLGSSGVGKSTLTNRLLGRDRQAVREVRADDSHGRHTTTARHLLPLPQGGVVIDTPGVRELQLWMDDDSGLQRTFADIAELAEGCRFRDCRHDGEPGCAVETAIAAGRLDPGRLDSLRKLQRELEFLDEKRATGPSNRKARWKAITKQIRQHKKHR